MSFDVLYGMIGSTGILYRVDPATAVVTLIGATGFTDVSAIAIHPTTEVMYGIATRVLTKHTQLISINLRTGVGTLVAALAPTVGGATMDAADMAFDASGNCFVWNEAATDRLATLNIATGSWTNLGNSAFVTTPPGISFKPSSGVLYVKGASTVVTCNTSTGLCTFNSIIGSPGGALQPALAFNPSSVGYIISSTFSLYFLNAGLSGGTLIGALGVSLDSLYFGPTAPVDPRTPIPVQTTRAPQTPCDPQAQISNGGKGKSGCSTGGLGFTSSFSGTYGGVPQHDDPADGETLTNKELAGVEVFVEIVHTDYPSGDQTTYRRAMVELADDPDYEGGVKEEGLLAAGRVEHGLGNEQGDFESADVDLSFSDVVDRRFRILLDDQEVEGDEVRVKLVSDPTRAAGDIAARVLGRFVVRRPGLSSGLVASLSGVDQLTSDFGPFNTDKLWPPPIPGTLWPAAPPDTIGLAFPRLFGEKTDEGARDPITNEVLPKGLVPLIYIGPQDISTLGGTSPDPPTDGAADGTIAIPVVVSTTNAVRAADDPGGWTKPTYPYIRAIVAGVRGPWSAVPAPFDPAGVTEPQGIDVFLHFNAIQITGADNAGGQPTVTYDVRVSDDATYHPETNPTAGLIGTATHDDLTKDSYYGDSRYSLLIRPGTPIAANVWDAFLVVRGRSTRVVAIYGSDLGGGDPTMTPDRTLLSIADKNGSDLLTAWDADGNIDADWPFADPWITYTDPTTGIAYDCTVVFMRGPIADDHKNGVVTLAANVIGQPDVDGNPIYDAHSVQQYWLENDLILESMTGTGCTNTTAPKWEDGTYQVRSSSFTTRQAFTANSIGGRGLTVGWYAGEQKTVQEWIRLWNRSTESVLGINGHGQIVVWGLDDTVDPTDWDVLEHDADLFGPITRVSGEERENVAAIVGDWDPDADKYRLPAMEDSSELGIAKYKNRRKRGDLVESPMLTVEAQCRWVIQQRVARLHLGTTLVEITGPIGFLDRDVGDGILLNSEEGTGADGYEEHPFIIMRRSTDLTTLLVTYTLWDVRDVLLATAYVDGLERLFELTDDSADAASLSDDEDVAALVAA